MFLLSAAEKVISHDGATPAFASAGEGVFLEGLK